MTKEYYATGRFSQEDADELGPEIERVAAACGGQATALDLLNAAQNPASPLHSRITWDDTEAAWQWRLKECRNILEFVRVRVVEGEKVVRDGPIVVNDPKPIEQQTDDGRTVHLRPYILVDEMRAQPDATERALRDALAYLLGAKKRLTTLRAVLLERYPSAQQVLDSLDELEAEVGQRKAA